MYCRNDWNSQQSNWHRVFSTSKLCKARIFSTKRTQYTQSSQKNEDWCGAKALRLPDLAQLLLPLACCCMRRSRSRCKPHVASLFSLSLFLSIELGSAPFSCWLASCNTRAYSRSRHTAHTHPVLFSLCLAVVDARRLAFSLSRYGWQRAQLVSRFCQRELLRPWASRTKSHKEYRWSHTAHTAARRYVIFRLFCPEVPKLSNGSP